MKRRRFLAVMGGGIAAAGAAAWGLLRRDEVADAARVEPPSALPAQHAETVRALVDTLLPATASFPGALALGVMTFLERELVRPEMEGTRRSFLRGAPQLDKLSRAQVQRPFAMLAYDERLAVVQAMLAGDGRAPRFDPAAFVRRALALTLEGAFGDPAHGGNHGGAGWQALGYVMHPPTACREGSCR
jgi:hypothetical protein